MTEEWKDIEGYEGRYQISNFGNVRSLAREICYGVKYSQKRNISEIMMRQFDHHAGYSVIFFNRPLLRRKKHFVHRLVACTFIENPEDKNIVNHKDGNKKNNHISNLEWMTESENTQHYHDVIKISNANF